jgi:hypothetical protein
MNTTMDPVTGYAAALPVGTDRAPSAVSWAAIAAGAVVAAATSLLLIALGGGVGLASLSPWAHAGVSGGTFTVLTAIGLIIVQWVSASVGGYIAGRLRTRWVSLHTHEVFFRDTAHGFITWATATLLVSVAAAAIASSTAGAGLHAASSIGAGAAMGAAASAPSAPSIDPYDVDTLLRPSNPSPSPAASGNAGPPGNDMRAQTTRILARALTGDDVSAEDRAYLAQVVSAQAGVSATDAQTRVDAAIAKVQAAKVQAKQAADKARKAAEAASIFTALAMLIGAFVACISAALGGKLRDLHP